MIKKIKLTLQNYQSRLKVVFIFREEANSWKKKKKPCGQFH